MRARWLVIAVVTSYFVMLLGGAALKPGYSHVSQFISELNASGTPHAKAIGWFGFVPFGVLAAALIAVVSRSASVRGASRLGCWLLLALPIGYIGSAVVPCDVGCPLDGSLNQLLHNLLGLFVCVAATLGLFLLSFAPDIQPRWRLFWAALSFAWLVLFSLMVDDSMAEWRGLLQRLSELIVFGSLCVCAWRVVGTSSSFKPTPLGDAA